MQCDGFKGEVVMITTSPLRWDIKDHDKGKLTETHHRRCIFS